jgi:hypothetical protein
VTRLVEAGAGPDAGGPSARPTAALTGLPDMAALLVRAAGAFRPPRLRAAHGA